MKVCRTARALRESPRRCRQTSHSRARPSSIVAALSTFWCSRNSSASGGWQAAPAAAARKDTSPHRSSDVGLASSEPGLRAPRAQGARLRRRDPSPPGRAFAHPRPPQAARRGVPVHERGRCPRAPGPHHRRDARSRRRNARRRQRAPPTRSMARHLPHPAGARRRRGDERRSRQGREAAPQARTLDEGEHVATLGLAMGPRDCLSRGAWALSLSWTRSCRRRSAGFRHHAGLGGLLDACAVALRLLAVSRRHQGPRVNIMPALCSAWRGDSRGAGRAL
jgi:hypothetical protein